MKNFIQQKWVQITAWCFIIVGTAVLILSGTSAGDIAKVPALVFGIIEAISILIVFIKSMINAKNNEEKNTVNK